MGRQRRELVLAVLAGLSCALAGCTRTDDQAASTPKPPSPSAGTSPSKTASDGESTTYTLRGVVREVNKDAREVTIRHEAIPGFMDAMTMPFRLEDAEALDDLRPGDKVEGKLDVTREGGRTTGYRLRDLAVTAPAPATSLTLDLSGGSPTLRKTPERLQPGDPVPDATLTGQDGKPFKLSDLRGKVVILTFIYTRCPVPDFCPAMDRRFADLAAAIAAAPGRSDRIRLLSVSFDPEHDTPEILRKHARIRGGTPPLWTFAVASHEELARLGPPLGLVYGPGKNEIIHNLCTAVIGPDGRLARLEVGTRSNKWSSADLLKTAYSLILATKK